MSIIDENLFIIDNDDIDINELRKNLFEDQNYHFISTQFSNISGTYHSIPKDYESEIAKIKIYLKYLDDNNNLLNDYTTILSSELESSQDKLNILTKNIEILRKDNNAIKNSFHDYIKDKESKVSYQYLNVEIYLDTNNSSDIFNVYSSVIDFTKSIDFEVFVDLEAIKGSWWKRFIIKSEIPMSSQNVNDRLKAAEQNLEVEILKSQSEIDRNQSEALLNIMTSLNGIGDAAIRIGSLLVVKTTNIEGEVNLVVQTLSGAQLRMVNKNPSLIKQPKNIFDKLSLINDEDDENLLN